MRRRFDEWRQYRDNQDHRADPRHGGTDTGRPNHAPSMPPPPAPSLPASPPTVPVASPAPTPITRPRPWERTQPPRNPVPTGVAPVRPAPAPRPVPPSNPQLPPQAVAVPPYGLPTVRAETNEGSAEQQIDDPVVRRRPVRERETEEAGAPSFGPVRAGSNVPQSDPPDAVEEPAPAPMPSSGPSALTRSEPATPPVPEVIAPPPPPPAPEEAPPPVMQAPQVPQEAAVRETERDDRPERPLRPSREQWNEAAQPN